MNHRIIRLIMLAALLAVWAWGGEGFAGQPRDVQREIESVRSFTYYAPARNWANFDLQAFAESLDGMKGAGANTVWLVLPWFDFQPQALPAPVWDEKALRNLDGAVGLAEKRGMKVILPLCYLGVGWSPKGIDARFWTLDPTYYHAFEKYALELIRRLSAHGNLLLMLYTEGSEPSTADLRGSPLAVQSFRAWCRGCNGDVGYWNKRWGTKYTWATLQPLGPDVGALAWIDHWRWVADLLVKTHGELARKIKAQVGQKALLGYHEYSLINLNWAEGESPIPKDNPYDFLSMVHYSGLEQATVEKTRQEMKEKLARFRRLYPKMPLMVGESGADTYHFGFRDQARAAEAVLGFAREEKLGINWWMWRDFTNADLVQCSLGVLEVDGKPKPAHVAIKKIWTAK